MADNDDRYRAPALDKGLDILELLARLDRGITQAELGKRLGRKQAEFYRMLERLVRRGYVVRSDGDLYSLSLKLFDLAQFYSPIKRLTTIAAPVMRDFTEKSTQSCHLTVFDRGDAVVIAQQETIEYWDISIRVGAHINLLNTSSGTILLAFRSPEERLRMLEQYSYRGRQEKVTQAFLDKLDETKNAGYDRRESDQVSHIYNLAAPILGSDQTAIAALSIPFIKRHNRPQAPDIDETLKLLLTSSEALSRQVGESTGHNTTE